MVVLGFFFFLRLNFFIMTKQNVAVFHSKRQGLKRLCVDLTSLKNWGEAGALPRMMVFSITHKAAILVLEDFKMP